MDTETLDKLYLEWSQFTKARTAREIAMEKVLERYAEDDASSDRGRAARDALALTSTECGNKS
jgi:hypothetical protein